jgi:hypothetical protein
VIGWLLSPYSNGISPGSRPSPDLHIDSCNVGAGMGNSQRSRTVIFRVTQTEYERLKNACAEAGGRTLSDYTRSELLKSIETDSQGLTLPERFESIDQKLEDLRLTITRVADALHPSEPE